ncbi:hypothetical protein PAXINDRAFT_100357, partial [Paxillus involutus ATCC 200175]
MAKTATLRIPGGASKKLKLLNMLDSNQQLSMKQMDDSELTDHSDADSSKRGDTPRTRNEHGVDLDAEGNDDDDDDNEATATKDLDELEDSDVQVLTPPPTTKKRKRADKGSTQHSEPPKARDISFIASITSAVEMKKAQSKRVPKNSSFVFNLDEPWDTLKAQILAKVSMAINPQVIDFDDYDVSFFIPHILPKPGLSLANQADFDVLIKRAKNLTAKDPTINLNVIQNARNQENNNAGPIEAATTKTKKR